MGFSPVSPKGSAVLLSSLSVSGFLRAGTGGGRRIREGRSPSRAPVSQALTMDLPSGVACCNPITHSAWKCLFSHPVLNYSTDSASGGSVCLGVT